MRNKTQAAAPPLERSWSSPCTRRKSGPFAVCSLCKNGIPLTYFIPSNKVTVCEKDAHFCNKWTLHLATVKGATKTPEHENVEFLAQKINFFLQDLRLFDTLFTKSFEILQIPSTLSRRIFCWKMSKISEFWGIFLKFWKKRSDHVRNKTQAATPPLERSWSSAWHMRRKSGFFTVFSLCKTGIPLTYFTPSNRVTVCKKDAHLRVFL